MCCQGMMIMSFLSLAMSMCSGSWNGRRRYVYGQKWGPRYEASNSEMPLITAPTRACLMKIFGFLPTQIDDTVYFDGLYWRITVVNCPTFALYYGLTTFNSQSEAKLVGELKRLWSSSLNRCSWLKVGSVWNHELLPPISIRLSGDQACSLAGRWRSQTSFPHHVFSSSLNSVTGILFG